MLDKHEDHSGTTLTSDKKLTSYKTLYLTPNRHFPKAELDNNIVRLSCLDLIVLAKSVLKVAYDPYDLKKLIKDETAVFMAALICKFWMIDCSRTKVAELFDPIPNISSDNPMVRTLTMTSELTSISCMPNICHCPTFDNKIIMYAIEPIKAGSQLFSSPHSASVYSTPKPRRQFFYKSFYEVPCNCRACKNNWDELLNNPAKDPPMCQVKREINQKLCQDMCLIRNDLEAHPFYKLNVVDQQFMIRVRKLLVDAWKDFDMPSQMIFYATKFVMEIYNDFFRPHSRRVRRAHYHSAKHSITDENFLSYKTLFLTPVRNLSMDQLDDCLLSSCFVLINFVKPVLKVTYDPCDIKKLMKDETAIFMGALILKLRAIHMNRGRMAKAWDPVPDGSGVDPTISSTVLTSRLTPISCTPNVEHCPTSNNQYFMYAIEPIKAGSQLLSSVFETSIYCNTTKHERQSIHKAYYKSLCKCRACTDNWDSILFNPTKVLSIPSEKSAILEELTAELCSLKQELRTHSECTIGLIDLQVIDRARKLMIRAWEHFPMPSLFTFEVVNFVIQLFENVFPYKVAVTEILM
ncbi:hypothetical protein QAD02_001283 [Eretmocerus hayati]|uniref:Uncharacterized protein n=1 Tax=Eretmocerus hayati TaxID=131215 RepID=A0ACC2NI80_9HYME|nr:hypothetical protein QAD02_001283 [Eretmocerus hayati]